MRGHRERFWQSVRSLEWSALWVLCGFTAVAVAGYWLFALNPERLALSPGALRFYAVSFRFFAQSHILLAGIVLGLVLFRAARWRWLAALAAVYLLSFASEFMSTGFGFPFGDYRYTALLGPKLGGRVPFVIPLSWFLMALPAYGLAAARFRGAGARTSRIALAAVLLTAWDLALDPAMSHLTAYWIWEQPGSYYGMPWVNLAGWYGTSLALMIALEVLRTSTWVGALETRWLAGYYATVLAMPVGMLAAAGAWGAVAVTLGGLGICALLVRSPKREDASLPRTVLAPSEPS
jgi:putative membrane protein